MSHVSLFRLLTALLLAIVILPISPVNSGGSTNAQFQWQIQTVMGRTRYTDFGGDSLVIDPSGTLHLAYGGDALYYVCWYDSSYTIFLADTSPGVGSYASIDIDSNNNPHIAYFDELNWDLKYATYDYNTAHWSITVVDSVGEVGWNASIEVDSEGRPHIAYYDVSHAAQKYATFSLSHQWEVVTIDNTSGAGQSLDITLSPTGEPFISYYVQEGGDLKLARHTPADLWILETVDADGNAGFDPSLEFDLAGKAHVVYYEIDNQEIRHAWETDLGWEQETVLPTLLTVHSALSLAVMTNGDLIFSYYDGFLKSLNFASRGDFWWSGTIDEEGTDTGWYTSLVLDPYNIPYISYFDPEEQHVKIAWRQGMAWVSYTIDIDGPAGLYNSVAVKPDGSAVIAHQDLATRSLIISEKVGATWQDFTLDPTYDSGYWPSMDLDSEGMPHLVYWDRAMHYIFYAFQGPTQWHLSPLTPVDGCNDLRPTLAISGSQPHIAWADCAADADLFYRTQPPGQFWVDEIVDSATNVGTNLAIDTDSTGKPYISYYDESYGRLFVAIRQSGGWEMEIVDDELYSGLASAIALDASDHPHIVYISESGLKHAWKDDGNWHISLIDSNANRYCLPSITFGAHGWLYASYWTQYPERLKFAVWAGGWVAGRPPIAGKVYSYQDMAVDPDGMPVISYYDDLTGDLMLATLSNLQFLAFLPLTTR